MRDGGENSRFPLRRPRWAESELAATTWLADGLRHAASRSTTRVRSMSFQSFPGSPYPCVPHTRASG